ncbi:hypothetical protein CVT26_006318 [Gymnopilus dilepis]|uniref:Uncharacterized protein n=1 Tax=Gymnopilus dilepis TaxID=231916 RepID=A0A409W639_9AGAR|nr:hypothetical protein CVT26_006318 [Gymnopilus dilepis]
MWLFYDITVLRRGHRSLCCSSCDCGRPSSIAIILLGSIIYTRIKHQESQAASHGNGSGGGGGAKSSTTSHRGSREYERLKMDDVEAGIREKEKQ